MQIMMTYGTWVLIFGIIAFFIALYCDYRKQCKVELKRYADDLIKKAALEGERDIRVLQQRNSDRVDVSAIIEQVLGEPLVLTDEVKQNVLPFKPQNAGTLQEEILELLRLENRPMKTAEIQDRMVLIGKPMSVNKALSRIIKRDLAVKAGYGWYKTMERV